MRKLLLLTIVLFVCFASCQPASLQPFDSALPDPQIQSEAATPIVAPTVGTADATSEYTQAQTENALSYVPETYQVESIGLVMQYPQGWMVDESVFGSRAYGANLTSWEYPPGQLDEVPDGETILSVTVYAWDPKGDLDAYIQTRMKGAWTDSGIEVIKEEELNLGVDHRAVSFTIRNTTAGQDAFFLVTLAGDAYMVLSGSGDLALLEEIAKTARFTS